MLKLCPKCKNFMNFYEKEDGDILACPGAQCTHEEIISPSRMLVKLVNSSEILIPKKESIIKEEEVFNFI